jgi:Zn-dependent metalloprotease
MHMQLPMKTNPSHSCPCGHRNPLHCILPPFILDQMLDSGNSKVRKIAKDNLQAAAAFRAIRSVTPTRSLSLLGATSSGKYREVYDAKNKTGLPGKLVRIEGGAKSKDPAVNEAYDGAGDTYDFFFSVLGRDSLDGHGLRLKSSVHVEKNLSNAFWNGSQMAYGDGDGIAFDRFTKSLDVIAHELTHGVVSYSADLVYQDEPGALNEHFADVFGTLVKQWRKKQPVSKADWLIGNDLIIPAPTRKAIRSMAAPGTAFQNDPDIGSDPQPMHYSKRYKGSDDYGGVHINSGIPNHAFYLAAMKLGGQAWSTVGPIWYEALTTRLNQTSSFNDLRNETIDLAKAANAATHTAVKAAWKAVGL